MTSETRSRARASALAGACMLLAGAATATAQAVFVDADGKPQAQSFSLPYAFANDGFGFAAGWVYGGTGFPQPQSSLVATAIAGTAPTGAAMLFGRDLRPPGLDRLFIDPFLSAGYYGHSDVYSDGNPDFPGERAGSHDSDADDFITGSGQDNLARIRLKWLLPIGRGERRIVDEYRLDRGVPVSGVEPPTGLDPFASGKTFLECTPFYRKLEVQSDDVPDFDLATNGLELSLLWDNRDFFGNPTAGQSIRLKRLEDFGFGDSSDDWSAEQLEIDQYFALGSSETFRQRVLALDFWTSYSRSWDEQPDGSIDHRPPPFYGSSLGGYWRMRGYPPQRFSDKAAICYSAELRLMPEWNPFTSFPALQESIGVQWVQLVPFVEVGRVAPSWEPRELHHEMKWDAGVGLRASVRGLIVRVDVAFGEEGAGVRMMVGQSYQF